MAKRRYKEQDDLDMEMDDEMMDDEMDMEADGDMDMMDDMDAEEGTPVAANPDDPFTPPEEGMIPVSWAYPGETAMGETMMTGDAQLAMEGEEMDVLSPEEEQVIVEYRKWKKRRQREGYKNKGMMADDMMADDDMEDDMNDMDDMDESAKSHMHVKAPAAPGKPITKGNQGSRSPGVEGKNMTHGHEMSDYDPHHLKKQGMHSLGGTKPGRNKAESSAETRRRIARLKKQVATNLQELRKKKIKEQEMSLDLNDDSVTIRYPRGTKPVPPSEQAIDSMYDDFDEMDLVESVRARAARRRKLLASMKRRSAQLQEEMGGDTPPVSDSEVEAALEDLHNTVMNVGARPESTTKVHESRSAIAQSKQSGPASKFVERYQKRNELDFKALLKQGFLG